MNKDCKISISSDHSEYVWGIFPLIGAGCKCSAYQQPRRIRLIGEGEDKKPKFEIDCFTFNV